MQPFPPWPPSTTILASSTNTRYPLREGTRPKEHTPGGGKKDSGRKDKGGDAHAVRHRSRRFQLAAGAADFFRAIERASSTVRMLMKRPRPPLSSKCPNPSTRA